MHKYLTTLRGLSLPAGSPHTKALEILKKIALMCANENQQFFPETDVDRIRIRMTIADTLQKKPAPPQTWQHSFIFFCRDTAEEVRKTNPHMTDRYCLQALFNLLEEGDYDEKEIAILFDGLDAIVTKHRKIISTTS